MPVGYETRKKGDGNHPIADDTRLLIRRYGVVSCPFDDPLHGMVYTKPEDPHRRLSHPSCDGLPPN